jgi:hypothetical protein
LRVFTQTGKPAPNTKPEPGWGTVSFGTHYAGTQANHAPTPVGFDSFFCVVTKWPFGDCQGEIGYGAGDETSLVSTVPTHMNLGKKEPKFKVSYATGVFAFGVGTVTSTALPHNAEEFTIPNVTVPQ